MPTSTCTCLSCPRCLIATVAKEAKPPARPPATGGAAVHADWTPPRR